MSVETFSAELGTVLGSEAFYSKGLGLPADGSRATVLGVHLGGLKGGVCASQRQGHSEEGRKLHVGVYELLECFAKLFEMHS